ncbi:MAG: hypothetical protein WC942_01340, partial [Clostridia bacterium]
RNTTRTGVSTNIIIQVDGNPIGAVATLSINEAREIAMIDEVGTDGHIDSVPKRSTDISGSCKRTRFDNMRIATAFSRGFVHVAAQRIPFDILILDIFAADEDDADGFNGADNVITTVIRNVWISKIGVTYQAQDFVIVEDLDWKAEYIYSYLGQGNSVVPGPLARQIPIIDNDPFERQADLGKRRGGLDAAGLIKIVDTTLGG